MNETIEMVGGIARARLEFYRDARGEHRWRLKMSNGRIIAASTEGYRNRANCAGNAQIVLGHEWQNQKPGGNIMSSQLENEIAALRNKQAALGADQQEEAQKISDKIHQLESQLTVKAAPKASAKEEKKSGKKTGE